MKDRPWPLQSTYNQLCLSVCLSFSITEMAVIHRIGGSRRGGSPRTCLLEVQFISFSCSFWQKSCQIKGFRKKLRGWHPHPPFGKFSIRHFIFRLWQSLQSNISNIPLYWRPPRPSPPPLLRWRPALWEILDPALFYVYRCFFLIYLSSGGSRISGR